MKEVILYSVQRALLLYNILLGRVHSVKENLRKVRTGGGVGGGGGGGSTKQVYTNY